tara:strand:+ start:1778 stop:2248 length:471 start_codon:yes stop_codon:yes gene_type:complete
MKKFAQGSYEVQNGSKYIGKKLPYYRSSWELAFMRMCDQHPNIKKWSSENVKIPYQRPDTGKYANYVPDFMIQYIDKDGAEHVELIEIKPRNQTTMESARTKGHVYQTAINAAKWTAAQEWCKRKGIRFKVLNEDQIFKNNKPRKSKKRISKPRIK